MKIYVDCPFCSSGNIYKGEVGEPLTLTCSDCYEVVSSSGKIHVIESNQLESCIICGCTKFNKGFIFPPWWLFGNITCYCCDSEYYGYEVQQNLRFYSDKTAKELRDLECCKSWRRYVKTVIARLNAE